MDFTTIKEKAISGVITFTARTIFIQVFTFIATFILTILLTPSIFGVFFIVSAIINFFVYFSDIGLAAALVQKKDKPSKNDLATTFTIQQLVVMTIVVFGFLFSSRIAHFYNLDQDGLLLLRVLIFSLLLSSLKTIPAILLERRLHFARLVIPQIAENIIFYSVAVILAYLDFGLASFTWAVLTRGIIGLVLIYILSPWIPTIGFNRESAKKLTSFGVPFQVNSILAFLKDDLLTIFLGKVLPFSAIGYIGWAQRWAYLPLRFFMDSVNKVAFPAYSRLQDHKQQLAMAIEKSLFFVTYLVYPSIFGIVAIAPSIIDLVPNYQKWQPALSLLYLFAINTLFSAVSTTNTNALFAIGKPKIVLNLMIFWTTLTWILTIFFVVKFGYLGVALASALVATTSLLTIYFVKRQVPVTFANNVFGPLLISILMFLLTRVLANLIATNFLGLIFTVIFGVIIYFVMSFAILRKRLVEDTMIIINSLILKK